MNAPESRLTFFRQSGWMVIATTLGGVFMYAVHLPAVAKLSPADYGVFTTLLQVLNLMLIPSVALQMVFTHQSAAAIHEHEQRRLTATARALLLVTFLIWIGAFTLALGSKEWMLNRLKITDAGPVWITLLSGWPLLWLPIVQGLLQGRQNFLWLGCVAIFNGFGRFLSVLIILLFLSGGVAGVMIGVFIGMCGAVALGAWQTRSVWTGAAEPVQWSPWLRRVVPLTLGLGAAQVMFSADMIVVKSLFEDQDQVGLYGFAGTIARGLVIFTAPLIAVMFPKVVRSAARSEKTDVLMQALLATGLLGAAAATACLLFPRLPILILNKPDYLPIAPLIPWFAWCMLPLTLANVLINNLLARGQFRVVPLLVLIALAYTCTLGFGGRAFVQLEPIAAFLRFVWILGAFNTLLFAVAAWFTFRCRATRQA